jgi:phospholipid transport system substrate-binding protein
MNPKQFLMLRNPSDAYPDVAAHSSGLSNSPFGSSGLIGLAARLHLPPRVQQVRQMRDTNPIPTKPRTFALLPAWSIIAYRAMSAFRVLTPYLFAAIFVVMSAGARAATPAETFVRQNIGKSYAILNDPALSPRERSEQFRVLLSGIMDAKRIALFTLGPYARTARSADIDDFANALSDFVAAVVQHDLAGNPGETLTVTGSLVRAPDDVIVTTTLAGSSHGNGAPIEMSFRIRKDTNGADTLVDLQVEGVSMAMAQRSDFSSWLQQHHGDVPALSEELRARVKQFRDDDIGASAKSKTSPAG